MSCADYFGAREYYYFELVRMLFLNSKIRSGCRFSSLAILISRLKNGLPTPNISPYHQRFYPSLRVCLQSGYFSNVHASMVRTIHTGPTRHTYLHIFPNIEVSVWTSWTPWTDLSWWRSGLALAYPRLDGKIIMTWGVRVGVENFRAQKPPSVLDYVR